MIAANFRMSVRPTGARSSFDVDVRRARSSEPRTPPIATSIEGGTPDCAVGGREGITASPAMASLHLGVGCDRRGFASRGGAGIFGPCAPEFGCS